MHSGNERIIRDPLKEIADVDNECSADRFGRDVNSVLVEDFEAAYHILVEDRECCLLFRTAFVKLMSEGE